jgi:hypothetical protein
MKLIMITTDKEQMFPNFLLHLIIFQLERNG